MSCGPPPAGRGERLHQNAGSPGAVRLRQTGDIFRRLVSENPAGEATPGREQSAGYARRRHLMRDCGRGFDSHRLHCEGPAHAGFSASWASAGSGGAHRHRRRHRGRPAPCVSTRANVSSEQRRVRRASVAWSRGVQSAKTSSRSRRRTGSLAGTSATRSTARGHHEHRLGGDVLGPLAGNALRGSAEAVLRDRYDRVVPAQVAADVLDWSCCVLDATQRWRRPEQVARRADGVEAGCEVASVPALSVPWYSGRAPLRPHLIS